MIHVYKNRGFTGESINKINQCSTEYIFSDALCHLQVLRSTEKNKKLFGKMKEEVEEREVDRRGGQMKRNIELNNEKKGRM